MAVDSFPPDDLPTRPAGAERLLDQGELSVLLESMHRAKIAVAGDFCLDSYWQLDEGPEEESIETGLPVHRVTSQRYSPGGAGNVVANLVALGVGQVRAIGVYGGDPFGRVLVKVLRDLGADTSGMLDLGPEWQTLVYAKPYVGGVEQSRLDFGTRDALPEEPLRTFEQALDDAAAWADVVVVNQQVTSCFAGEEIVARVNAVIAAHPGTVFVVDARMSTAPYVGAVLKLNVAETVRRLGAATADAPPDDLVIDLARRVAAQTGRPFFITRGERGIVAADDQRVYIAPGVEVGGEVDPVGAGDTVVAAISAVLACGGTPAVAAYVANIAASVTVRKLRATGTAAAAELTAAAADTDYVYSPELAEIPARARFHPGSEIEIILDPPREARPGHVVFDFDGTLSTLREGWEQIMEPVMVRAILGDASSSVSTEAFAAVSAAAREFIDRTTGVQTLVQMQGLVRLVRQFGYVAEKDILDERGYKEIYNTELLEMVRARLAKIGAGQLERTDFHMKNAVPLVEALRSRGMKLYLASGTDVEDVRAEARALGFAEFFEGRIYGSVGDVKVEAKRVVLDRIFRDNAIAPEALVTIGDGPVEMRETRKRGGTAVGVYSDERRRFGANLAKRRRLIRGGATLLLPDFTDLGTFLAVLGL
ncbi:MAG: PfkB family carbohydrate kinase [Acidimicrobiales bacterium]|jgi:rfaE bifunctional protein kinase chain/domain